jgi:thiol-disulfide isomerase/thioredoxin
MTPRSHESRPSVLGSISPRLTALILGVSLVGAAQSLALAAKGDDSPAPTPKNAAKKPDPGQRDTGHAVRLHFRLPAGMTFPADPRPEVYAENDRDQARLMWQPENRRGGARNSSLLPVQAVGSGQFEVRLSHPEQPFDVAIHTPGFLRFFERGPFHRSKIKNGLLEIEVPKPATREVHFDPGKDQPEKRPFDGQRLNVLRRKDETRDSYLSAGRDLPFDGLARITDLAAGDYLVGVETLPKPGLKVDPKTMPVPVNPGAYVEKRRVTLRPGQSQLVSFHYVPIDLDVFRGNRTAVLRSVQSDGKSVGKKEIWVGYFDAHYGGLTVFEGPASGSGEVVLKDITDRVPEIMPGAPYFVFLGNRCLGRFGFSKRSGAETFTFRLWPGANDLAPDAELFKVADGKPIKLGSLRGKFVWVDFWATWCKPCQPAMKELDETMADEPSRWKDRMVVVPVSIDDTPELVTRHLAKRGWTHLERYWAGPNNINGFQSPAARLFVIDSIPTSFLIGPDGRILWRGSPEPGGKSMKHRIEEALGP